MSSLLPRRKHIRLKGYDYSQTGLYFITVCVQARLCLFGNVQGGEMILNDAGRMVERWYDEIERKYPDKRCHNMVVMPNHFHCIIEMIGKHDIDAGNDINADAHADGFDIANHTDAHVGAPLRGRPINKNMRPVNENGRPNDGNVCPVNKNGQPYNENVQPINENTCQQNEIPEKYGIQNIRYGATISDVMDWFKTMTTNEYIRCVKQLGWKRYNRKLWQRNFYEHIILTPEAYERIADYIDENPSKWNEDNFFNTKINDFFDLEFEE